MAVLEPGYGILKGRNRRNRDSISTNLMSSHIGAPISFVRADN